MHPVRRLLDVFSLSALAIAYPTFDLLSRNTEFFVARNTTLAQVLGLVCIICVLTPALLFGLELVVQVTGRRAVPFAHAALLVFLVAALVMPWLNRLDGLTALAGPIALLGGAVLALAHYRTTTVRMFVTALSPAILVVPGVFLSNPDVRGALIQTTDGFVAADIDDAPPIVFIVFDEFPLNSLLDENYEIDRGRYPNFAALGEHAYWFRNASTVSSQTTWAIPAIVTGRYPFERGAVPTRRYYPDSLFTLLSARYDITVFGRFLQLCPLAHCQYDLAVQGETVGALSADVGLVWLHIVLPKWLAASLPPIVGDWIGLARARQFRVSGDTVESNERGAEFDRFLDVMVGGEGPRLYFLHSMLPHMPFEYVPSGLRYRAPDYQGREVNGKRLFEAASATFADVIHQRHLLQVGFVDHLIGRLLDRLRELRIYDEALVIVTSDHGASYRDGVPRRVLTHDNYADVVLVPLLIKLPGQREGVISDRNVQSIDILPTIADVLSIDLSIEVDGRSLLDHAGPERRGKTFVRRNLTRVRFEELDDGLDQSRASLARKVETFGTGTNARLYGIGETAHLLGMKTSDLAGTSQHEVGILLANGQAFDVVHRPAEPMPLYVRGTVEITGTQPIRLALVVNDRVVSTTESFQEDGHWVFACPVPESAFTNGRNELRVFAIENTDGQFVLAPVS